MSHKQFIKDFVVLRKLKEAGWRTDVMCKEIIAPQLPTPRELKERIEKCKTKLKERQLYST